MNLIELSPIPPSEEKPSNRGKFSPDREFWEELHKARYTKWQLGSSAEDIGAEEGVTSNAVRHSIAWCEGRLSSAQVVHARSTRLRLLAFNRLEGKYINELDRLMSDPNPIVRTRALEAFRKTIGLEAAGGVQVNVNQQTAIAPGQPGSFEEALTMIRRVHLEAGREPRAIPESAGPPDSDAS